MDEREAETEDGATERPPGLFRLSFAIVRAMLRHKLLLAAYLVSALGVAFSAMLFASLIVPFIRLIAGGGGDPTAGAPLGFLLPKLTDMTPVQQFQTLAVAMFVVAIIRSSFSYADSRTSGYMALVIERDYRQRVFDEIIETDLGYINKERTANLFTILHTYPRQAAAISDQFLSTFTKAVTFASIVYTLLFVSWQLTLIAAGLGLAAMLAVMRLRFIIRRMGRDINVQRVKLNQTSLEALQSMKLIRLFSRERYTQDKFRKNVRELQRQSYRRASLQALTPQLQRIIGMALFAGLLFMATLILPSRDAGWVTTLGIFVIIANQLQTPMSTISKQQTKILSEMPALEEIISFLEKPKPKMKDGTRAFDRLRKGVRFENVTFGFETTNPPVLHDVTLDIKQGELVALVGASGSGKSTAISLLARLADPTSGRVLVDGVDLREFTLETWRRRIAVVSQETFLFNATVRDNIRFGRLDATNEEVEAAAKLAEAHEFILQLEGGYETSVGDRGVRLSGGQAQRLAIARALLADPDILVLDEATSALDTATERDVQRAIDRASRGRTVLAVAHRLSTVRNANRIVVLEAGRVVEMGTHSDLLARRGAYARYVAMQDLTEASPPRAGAVAGARAVLVRGTRTAKVDLVDGRTLEVPVRASLDGETPLDTLQGHDGNGLVVWPGGDRGLLRLDGELVDDVTLYVESGDGGKPRRVRVRGVARTPN